MLINIALSIVLSIKMSFTAQLSIEVISFPVLYIITLMRYWDFNKKKNAKQMAVEKNPTTL